MTLEYLQNYWWCIVSVLGGILVFLLFVQGGQSMLLNAPDSRSRSLLVNCMGHKWELTFTTLVTFGGALFASFPLFYSTSFGGAYWLWMLILFTFVLQAVSYEYRNKKGNLYGRRTYDIFLFINGSIGCILLGVAVAMFFFGADFSVSRSSLTVVASPVISRWAPTHGLEAIYDWKNLVLGFAVLFLARTLACMYMLNNISWNKDFAYKIRMRCLTNAAVFLVFFLWFLVMLLTATGYSAAWNAGQTIITEEEYKYLHNFINGWWIGLTFLLGVVLVLTGIIYIFSERLASKAIWFAGFGTFLTVCSLFWCAGYMDTAFYPSLTDPQSSLTIRNASSSEFTLRTMSYVSIAIPFVVAYIAYVWRRMDAHSLSPSELDNEQIKY